MNKVLISISSFAENDDYAIKILEANNIEIILNTENKKLSEDKLIELIEDCDAVIAGTEKISQKVIDAGKKLKIIARVGIGVNNIDLVAAKRKKIKVSYTPEVPAPYLAEMTIGIMLTMLRHVHISNLNMHKGVWSRMFGRSITNSTIGIIGYGRVGKNITNKIKSLRPKKIFIYDISNEIKSNDELIEFSALKKIYTECDIISLHLPLNTSTYNLITKENLLEMKSDAIIINNSRGGIINEQDLYEVLKSGHLSGAAIDVFEDEPYNGNLKEIDNCLLTGHMGSMSIECRNEMEVQAANDVIRAMKNEELKNEIPEYVNK